MMHSVMAGYLSHGILECFRVKSSMIETELIGPVDKVHSLTVAGQCMRPDLFILFIIRPLRPNFPLSMGNGKSDFLPRLDSEAGQSDSCVVRRGGFLLAISLLLYLLFPYVKSCFLGTFGLSTTSKGTHV